MRHGQESPRGSNCSRLLFSGWCCLSDSDDTTWSRSLMVFALRPPQVLQLWKLANVTYITSFWLKWKCRGLFEMYSHHCVGESKYFRLSIYGNDYEYWRFWVKGKALPNNSSFWAGHTIDTNGLHSTVAAQYIPNWSIVQRMTCITVTLWSSTSSQVKFILIAHLKRTLVDESSVQAVQRKKKEEEEEIIQLHVHTVLVINTIQKR